METEVNLYQSLANKLEIIIESGLSNSKSIPLIKEVQETLIKLSASPKLPKNVEQFRNITTDLIKTYMAKNQDYDNSFEQSLDEFGLIASVVRVGDKMNRIKSLINKPAQVKEESIRDTLFDMANYAIMTIMWLNKQDGTPHC